MLNALIGHLNHYGMNHSVKLMKTKMIDELVWEHNRKWVFEGLQAPETCPVESYTRHAEISDYETILAVKIVL